LYDSFIISGVIKKNSAACKYDPAPNRVKVISILSRINVIMFLGEKQRVDVQQEKN